MILQKQIARGDGFGLALAAELLALVGSYPAVADFHKAVVEALLPDLQVLFRLGQGLRIGVLSDETLVTVEDLRQVVHVIHDAADGFKAFHGGFGTRGGTRDFDDGDPIGSDGEDFSVVAGDEPAGVGALGAAVDEGAVVEGNEVGPRDGGE